jgi:hypothetical protein
MQKPSNRDTAAAMSLQLTPHSASYSLSLAAIISLLVLSTLLLSFFLSPGAASILCALVSFGASRRLGWLLPRVTANNLLLLVALLMLGFVNCGGHELYDVAKDAWYFCMPLLGVLTGSLLVVVGRSALPVVSGVLIAGTISALVFIGKIALDPNLLWSAESVAELRSETGAGSALSLFALMVTFAWFGELKQLRLFRVKLILPLFTVVNFLAVGLSFSRTLWLGLTSLLLVAMCFRLSRRRVWYVALTILTVGCAFALFISLLPETLTGSVGAKIGNSVAEIAPSDYTSQADVNANWRGFEALMGLNTYFDGPPEELIFGHGFGTLINLGLVMNLGGQDFDRIPILHNGYVYLLVKVGALGCLLYIAWLVSLFYIGCRTRLEAHRESRFQRELLVMMTLYLAASTLVISGIFNKLEGLPLSMMLGATLPAFSGGRLRVSVTTPSNAARGIGATNWGKR